MSLPLLDLAEHFAPADAPARPLHLLRAGEVGRRITALPESARRWLEAVAFRPKAGELALFPGTDGLPAALAVVPDSPTLWDAAAIRTRLPAGAWRVVEGTEAFAAEDLALGWLLAGYRFARYRTERADGPGPVRLRLDPPPVALAVAEGVFLARALIDTPAADMGPAELEEAARDLAAAFEGRIEVVHGEELEARGFPLVWAVGRASFRTPRVIDLRFGPEDAPKLTLVGKGVCFDTGGLDIKPPQFMRHMKKDMAGAAVVLGLTHSLLAAGARLCLRVIVPALDNAISGAAFRPGDVLRSRKGLTIEVGNTDAEGRLALADALTAAEEEGPDLLVDVATLTGAARVALGPDLPALFTPDDDLADRLLEAGRRVAEPLWRLPLHEPYRAFLESRVADLDNAGESRHAGAITAALFLQRFVSPGRCWAHLDVYGWNDQDRPGRPRGGEASALRPLFAAITAWLEEQGA